MLASPRMDSTGLTPRVLIGGMLVAVAVVFLSTAARMPGNPVREATAGAVARTVWPGAFLVEQGDAGAAVPYQAAGLSYLAEVGSAGFSIRPPDARGPEVSVRLPGARAAVMAQAGAPLGATLTTIFRRPEGNTYAYMGRVVFPQVYPGVDVVYRDADGKLELDFVVAPHASPARIELAAEEGTRIRLEARSGDAVLNHGATEYRLHAPVAYQEIGAQRVPVPASFRLHGKTLQFELGAYDPARPLVIDPLVNTYSALFGSVGDAYYDEVRALTSDADGNIYFAGRTNFDRRSPGQIGIPTGDSHTERMSAIQAELGCYYGCGYIAKLSPEHRLIYTMLIHELDFRAIAVDTHGSAYATGTGFSVDPFPITPNNLGTTSGTFVLKLDPAGNDLAYFGFFPATSARGIAVDSQGSAYVVGSVQGPLLNATPGALRAYQSKSPDLTNKDGYLVKVDPQGVNLVYATYLGGYEDDEASAVVLTPDGRAIVAGNTLSSDFVGVPGTPAGYNDAFVLEISAAGDQALHGRMLGGEGSDAAFAIARGQDGSYFVGGATNSDTFPVTPGAWQTRMLGFRDGWIARLAPDLSTVYASYYGGSSYDGVQAVAADAAGNAYFTGVAASSDLSVTPDASQSVPTHFLSQFPVLDDAFYRFAGEEILESYMAVLAPDGRSLVYGTYLGSMGLGPIGDEPRTFGNAITVAPNGTVVAGGTTTQGSFPTTADAFYPAFRGSTEGFLVSWRPGALRITNGSGLPIALKNGATYSEQLLATGGTPPYAWSLSSGQLPHGLSLTAGGNITGVVTDFILPDGNTSLLDAGTQFTVKLQDATGAVTHKQFVVQIAGPEGIKCVSNVCSMTIARGGSFTTVPIYPARAVPPVTLSAPGGLPTGFTLTDDGTLDARLDSAGVFNFQVNATDAAGTVSAISWRVTVTDPNAPPPSPPAPPAPAPSSPAKSSGGGGSTDLLVIFTLALMTAGRLRKRANVQRPHP